MQFNFQKFEDIPVSTKTFIVITNVKFELKKMFDELECTPYVLIPKKRGRKKVVAPVDPNLHLKDGDIISVTFCSSHKGALLKKKKKGNDSRDYFRNALPIVMMMDKKMINFKITANGKFQMTGCRNDSQAEKCIKKIWELVKDKKDFYSFQDETNTVFNAIFIPAMRNIDFSLGFFLDREKLDEYINSKTDYHSLLETSIGYTGVNIKFPVTKSIADLKLKKITFKNNKWQNCDNVSYSSYLDSLKPKEKLKKLTQDRYVTFLVFHSGKTICTAMCEDFARESYYKFLDIVKENYKTFQEQIC